MEGFIMTNTNANNTTNTNNRPVDLKAIQKAEQFLSENFLMGVFYLFCGEIREQGIKEKWDHTARWNAIARWVGDVELHNPFNEKPKGIEAALTEWYEKIYLPSKWTGNRNYNKDNKEGYQNKKGEYNKSNYDGLNDNE